MAACIYMYFKLAVLAAIALFVCFQQDNIHASPIANSYSSYRQRMGEALVQVDNPQLWKTHLLGSEAYNKRPQPQVDAFEIEPGMMTIHV